MRSRVRLLTCALAAMAAPTDLDAQTISPASAGGPSVVGGAGGCRCGTTVRFATLSITDRQDGNTLSNRTFSNSRRGTRSNPQATYAQKF